MFRRVLISLSLVLTVLPFAQSQKTDSTGDKHLDIQSSAGDLHVGSDATSSKAGLPLYPGARLRHDKENSDALNVGVLTEAFGIKLVVAKYESDDAPGRVIDFYREALKKYGKVVECHTHKHDSDSHVDMSDDESSKEVKCEGENSGPITELKVGTENNQHVVSVEPNNDKNGSTFALVYLHTRGKQGDI